MEMKGKVEAKVKVEQGKGVEWTVDLWAISTLTSTSAFPCEE
jgi:hypothetical protein